MRGLAYFIVRILPIADALALASLVALAVTDGTGSLPLPTILLLLLVVSITRYFLNKTGVYDSHRVEASLEVVRRVLVGHIFSAAIILPAAALAGGKPLVIALALAFAASVVLASLFKAAVHATLQSLRRGGFDRRNVLYMGTWAQAEEFAAELAVHPEWGLHLGCVGTGTRDHRLFHSFPSGDALSADVEEVLKSQVVDEVLIPVGDEYLPDTFGEARLFEQYGVMVRAVFPPTRRTHVQPRLENFNGAASVSMLPPPRSEKDMAVKRAVDLFFTVGMLLVLLPLVCLIAAMVKLTSPGPVLFVQTRVGLNGRRFRMFKFRTMVDGAEFLVRQADRSINRGPIYKNPQDYRITPIGRLLRKFSLDELPQLMNVLLGDMSLVGPRPLPVDEAQQIAGEYRRRFSVLPGLTCIWQVSGRSDISYENWMKYDLQYVDRWSLWSDTILLLRTIPVVILGRGGY